MVDITSKNSTLRIVIAAIVKVSKQKLLMRLKDLVPKGNVLQ